MIILQDLTLRRGARSLLERVSVTINTGQRVGVIGRNGVGKSSLFAALRGELQPDGGGVSIQRGLIVTSVAQETPALPQPAIEYALDGDTELREVERRLAEAEAAHDAERMAVLHDRMAAIGGYSAKARAAQLLHGLGFAPHEQENPVASFSGGWRMRLNLARTLLRRADLLLLDEPTNHLDLDAVLWLQEELANFTGTLLLISHDREFLDAVTTHTLHLAREQATLYIGNYSQFERQRAERLTQQAASHAQQQRRIAHLQKFVDRFRAQATKARQAQSRLKALERMELVAPVLAENEFSFEFPKPERVPSPLLRVMDGVAGYPDKPLLKQLKLVIHPGERVALLGANGAGKSTLIRSLMGELPWLGGEATASPYLKVGYFAQHQLEQLDPEASPLVHLRRLDPQARDQPLRDFLGSFNFVGDRQLEAIAPFSGGEKARLALALVVYRKPNLLLLDEPTNHLDLDMRQALEAALQDYAGAVILVSHDRHLVQACCDTLWRVADGGCHVYDGDLDDYAKWLRQQRRTAQKQGSAPARALKPEHERRMLEKALKDAVRKLDKQIEKLRAELATLETRLTDPTLYEASHRAEASQLTQRQAAARAELAKAEEEWLEKSDALESL